MEDLLLFTLTICGTVQLFYAFYYFLPLASHPEEGPPQSPQPVSVLVCAHDELENLRRLVPLLLDQDHPAFELVLVDDRSTDGTSEYLRALAGEFPQVRTVLVDCTPGDFSPKKYALTLGVKVARHPLLLFTDADCIPMSRQWIRKMQSGFNNGAELVLGYSSYRKTYGFLNVLIKYETFVTAIQYLSFAKRGQPYMGVGRNLAYTQACFYRNQGFTTHINSMGGDDDLFVRDAAAHTQTDIVISKDAQTESLPKRTYQEWIIQKRRHLSAGRQYKLFDKVRIGAFILSNILFFVLALIMLLAQAHLALLGMLFGVRCLAVFLVYYLVSRRLQEKLSFSLLPIVDLVYFLNYVFLGVSVLLIKKTKWK